MADRNSMPPRSTPSVTLIRTLTRALSRVSDLTVTLTLTLTLTLSPHLSATTPAKGNRSAEGSTRMTTMPDTSSAEEPPRRCTSVMQDT